MRNKLATVAAIFVPLGFFGGLTTWGIGIGLGSAVFWGIVFLVLRQKS